MKAKITRRGIAAHKAPSGIKPSVLRRIEAQRAFTEATEERLMMSAEYARAIARNGIAKRQEVAGALTKLFGKGFDYFEPVGSKYVGLKKPDKNKRAMHTLTTIRLLMN